MIKNYSTFINERKANRYLPMDNKSINESYIYDYQIDEDDIDELFVEFGDEGFTFDMKYGFVSKEDIKIETSGEPGTSLETVEIPILCNREYHPAIHIHIENDDSNSKKDLTDSLLTMIDYLESDYTVYLYADGLTSKEYITVKNGEFLVDDFDIKDNSLNIFLISENETKTFTQLDIAKYYKFKGYETIGENIFIDVNIEDIADMTINNRCSYKRYIADEVDYENYDTSYRPDITYLLSDLLTDENADRLLKNMLDGYKGDYLEENDIDINELKSSNVYLEDLRNDMLDDIQYMYADWESQDQFYKNVEEVKDSFDRKLQRDFKYTVFKKDVEKSYMSGDTQHKYTNKVTVYRIEFDNFLIDDYDREDIYNWDVHDLLNEYCSNNIDYDLNPSFSAYGSVDFKEFNVEVASMLK